MVQRRNVPVGQDETRHAEDRCKPPHGCESLIGADWRQPAFELLARDIVALFLRGRDRP